MVEANHSVHTAVSAGQQKLRRRRVMAYNKLLGCRECPRKAVMEIFNHRNESQGFFCTMHGKLRLGELQKEEKEGKRA